MAENDNIGTKDSPPPEYGTASNGDAEAGSAPPTYDSLFGKLKQANDDSENPMDYAKKSMSVLSGACGCCVALIGVILCCGLGLALPIAQIVIGALHLHDCPINYLIPIYLIVGGVFSLVAGGSSCGGSGKNIGNRLRRQEEATEDEPQDGKQKASSCCGGLISLFLLVWLCCGTAWTVTARPLYTPDKYLNATGVAGGTVNPLYCDSTVFHFAYWLSIVTWIVAASVVGLSCLVCCCLCCIRCCVGNKK